jgi:hypothetical protein
LLKNFLNPTSFIYPPSPLPSLKYIIWMKSGWWLIIPWNSIQPNKYFLMKTICH